MSKKKQAATIEVGQTLYSLNVGNAARGNREQELTEYIVTKVGRKYFWIQHKEYTSREIQFFIEGMDQKTEYMSDHKLFTSPEVYHNMKKRDELLRKIQTFFSRIGRDPDIDTNSLYHICQIIDEEAD